jgi:chromosome segregation protein
LRLADIIKEVKRQIGSLQRQAGKARRYQVLLADLRMLETHAAKRQFDSLEEQRAAAAAEHAALSEKQLGAEQEIERQESEVAVQRAALEEMEQRLNTARQAVNDLRTRISNHENRILFNNERAAEFSQLTERYRLDVASAEEKFRIAETQLRDTDAELAQITEMLAAELRRMEEKQAANAALTAERQGAEQTIAAVVGDTGRIENKLSSLRGQIAGVMQQRDGAEARLSILSGELEQLTFAFAQFHRPLARHAGRTRARTARPRVPCIPCDPGRVSTPRRAGRACGSGPGVARHAAPAGREGVEAGSVARIERRR